MSILVVSLTIAWVGVKLSVITEDGWMRHHAPMLYKVLSLIDSAIRSVE